MTDRRLMLLGLAATVLVLLTGWLWLRPASGDPFAGCRRSVVAGGAGALGGSFTLTDETGARVTDARVFDRPAIFYMGYTYCPCRRSTAGRRPAPPSPARRFRPSG